MRFFRHHYWVYAAFFAAAILSPPPSSADIYRSIDKTGVIHFTNIPRSGRKWKRIMRTGPGKARAVHARRAHRRLSAKRYNRYNQIINRASTLYHIPIALIHAVTRVESDFDRHAVSSAGAHGLMQLMPKTARAMGVTDRFDAAQNIYGGTRYLRLLANRFEGDLTLTLASYHAGPGAVAKYGGVPPYQTTRRYIRLVLSRYNAYKKSQSMR